MHTSYHGGVASDVAATMLVELCSEGRFGCGDLTTQLQLASTECRNWMKENGIGKRYGYPRPFTKGRVGKDKKMDFPTISTRFKAMHVKMMTIWISHVVLEDVTDNYKLLRASCAGAFVHMQMVFDNGGVLLSDSEVAEAQRLGRFFLMSYQVLANRAADLHEPLYKMRPKYHSLDHIVRELVNKENPRFFMCFGDEDLMGKIARVAFKTHPSNISRATLMRYVGFLEERWDAMSATRATTPC